jgi:hypothetical protein
MPSTEEGKYMLNIPPNLHVRSRVPPAGWAVAAMIALFSLMSSFLHAIQPSDHMPRAEQHLPAKAMSHQAKV